MDVSYQQLVYGALLHDIGKLVQRAGPGEGSHGDRGAEFVSDELVGDEWREVVECVRYHHAEALKKAKLANSSLAYIIYEADNIAAGADRRKRDAATEQSLFRRDMPLYSIFNVFKYDGSISETVFPLKTIEESGQINFSEETSRVEISPQKYSNLFQVFKKGFRKLRTGSDSLESLLKLLEVCLVNVPSSTSTKEMPDISLYNHSKITAMIAGCLYYYFAEGGIKNYRELCFDQPEKLRQEKTMLLVSGDMSGIQNFIYTISSKGALKSLRGRSFYLEIFLEHVIDEILELCGLCRANLLYSGGGHFYLVLPHTEAARVVLETAKERVNSWLMGMYSTELYLEISYIEASAHELANGFNHEERSDNFLGNLFRRAARANSRGKLQRYSHKQLEELIDPDSQLNSQLEAGRECSVCGSSRHQLAAKDDNLLCSNCLALFNAGDKLARMMGGEEERPVIVVRSEDDEKNGLPLPSVKQGQVYLSFAGINEAQKLLRQGQARRVYSINSLLTGKNYMTNLWAGTYSAASSGEGLVDFATLAQRSCGIKRIGVLRADVDNLGRAFIKGFVFPNGKPDRYRYVSLSRNASLSYNLSIFFKYEINKICCGKLGTLNPFKLPGKTEGPGAEKNVVIVYAGGDDVFIVGAWDDVLELAVDLHQAFKKFTNGKMTLSAGVGIFHDSFPISQMAQLTGHLEQSAKSGTKNQIALFGPEINGQEGKQEKYTFKHIYQWDDFTGKVCGEKLGGLLEWFSIGEDNTEPGKLNCGMSRLYKLLQLFRGIEEGWDKDDRIELARLAYVLGRMEPSGKNKELLGGVYLEMKRAIYQWALSAKDRKELITALTILIYLNRKGEDDHE
ncbi:type III-A CRISPR-associated protein Cas10/Csm1 [Desulfotruncus alcoholivorax]|uniref:type III-A CRISPR-associated protein Cas10/Csm1 n=1 Tax=Desulfotruncus alcoholivorax TaxID=265477 RepID=UPI0004881ECA|nr:type III-A CRISPR-associated protein Cas10/Csm1 [Desulfotruncus alcoholivorax]